MPIYEYRRPDGSTFEILQSFSDDPLTRDPDTGVKVKRVLHAPALHFKGSGFYNTDYGTRKRQRETAASAEGSSGDSANSSGGDSTSGGDSGSSADGKSASAEDKSKPKTEQGGSAGSASASKSVPAAAKS